MPNSSSNRHQAFDHPTAASSAHIPTSTFLEHLLANVSTDHVTIGWVITKLGERSFGLFMLILAVIGIAPGLSPLVGVLLPFPAVQMMLGRDSPSLPRFLADRPLPVSKLRYGIEKSVPLLRWLERLIRPRWPTGIKTTKGIVGGIMFLLGLSLFAPVPFSQVIPALTIMLVALAYLEGDGLVLGVATLIAIVSLLITAGTVWAAVAAGGAILDL